MEVESMTIKMIASDMDGTFLNERGKYDRQRFENILVELEKKDISFVVASGNSMPRLEMMFEGLTDRLSFVAENGSLVLDKGDLIARNLLDRKLVKQFLDYFEGNHAAYRIMLAGQNNSYMLAAANFPETNHMIDEKQLEALTASIKVLDSFDDLPEDQIFKISMMVDIVACADIIARFNNSFQGNLTATTSGYGTIDIIQTGIHKAWGLQQLMNKYHLSSENLMTFGDGGNDIEMLQLAKNSYAMANAPKEVKEVAAFLAPHHKESGVLQVIEQLLTQI